MPIANTNRSLKLNQTTPATGPAGSVSHVVFTEDNTQLVASVKGVPPQPGFLAVWDVAADGSLSQDFQAIAPAQGGLLPFSMTVIPGKNAILATDAGLGFDIFDFNGAGNNGTDRSSTVPIDGQAATCWSSFSQKTGNFYLTDIGTSQVTEINIDDNLKGTIVKVIVVFFKFDVFTEFICSNTIKAREVPRLITTSLLSAITSRSTRLCLCPNP